MDHIRCDMLGDVAVIALARGKANAMNAAMVSELNRALADACASSAIRALVIASDRPKFFSAGFDIVEVFQYDRPTMATFFADFIALYEGLHRAPKPVVAALGGHAFAGGALLAVACDLRVMADGPFGFAINEVNLGVTLPTGFIRVLVDAVGAAQARAILLSGDQLSPARALEIGLVSELAPPDLVTQRAVARASELALKPPGAYAAMKANLLEACGHAPGGEDRGRLETFLDGWFSVESVERRAGLLESLRK